MTATPRRTSKTGNTPGTTHAARKTSARKASSQKSGSQKTNSQKTTARSNRRRASNDEPWWLDLPREELLDLRVCDLDLRVEGTWLEGPIGRLLDELAERGLRVRPQFWLSDDWFCPEGIAGIAIPFYLAHPRLMRIERRFMHEVEGGSQRECLRLLRHEMGHVLQHAFHLQRRARWQRAFGSSRRPYPEFYSPNPTSRNFVQYLDYWYAQSHPLEDFAETFAVWLDPRSRWRRHYLGWGALTKLLYVDELMGELQGGRPTGVPRRRVDDVSQIKRTLREYYREKRERYGAGFAELYDRDLRRLFTPHGNGRASVYLRTNRRAIRERVLPYLENDGYAIDHVLRELMGRCDELRLALPDTSRNLLEECTLLVTVHTTQCLHGRREWYPM